MQPPSNITSSRSRGLIWLAGLGLALALLVGAVAKSSRTMREEQTRREFTQLQRMLEQFKARHGSYPEVLDNAVLLRCLLGRAGPRGEPLEPAQPWFLTGARLYFRDEDPTRFGNVIVDPWGQPYVYVPLLPFDDQPEGFLLLSGGPDRKHSSPTGWMLGATNTAPEDADNLSVNSRMSRPQ